MSDVMDLWRQARKEQTDGGKDDEWRRTRYRELMTEAGLLRPGPWQALKCGWGRKKS